MESVEEGPALLRLLPLDRRDGPAGRRSGCCGPPLQMRERIRSTLDGTGVGLERDGSVMGAVVAVIAWVV